MSSAPPPQTVVVHTPAPQSNMMGVVGFVLSLLGLVLSCGLLSPLAVLVSFIGCFKKPNGLAIAGLIIGIIGSIWMVVFLLFFGATFLAAIGVAAVAVAAGAPFWEAQIDMSQIAVAVEAYEVENGELPASIDDIAVTLDVSVLTDAWGQPYAYQVFDDGTFELSSIGEDGFGGTDDDIIYDPDASWEMEDFESGSFEDGAVEGDSDF